MFYGLASHRAGTLSFNPECQLCVILAPLSVNTGTVLESQGCYWEGLLGVSSLVMWLSVAGESPSSSRSPEHIQAVFLDKAVTASEALIKTWLSLRLCQC